MAQQPRRFPVFQFYNPTLTPTAQKNVELLLLATKLSAAQRKRNAEVRCSWSAWPNGKAPPGGTVRRPAVAAVAIVRAIVSDPTLRIATNPPVTLTSLGGGIPWLQTLNREHGKTIVMVTHDPWAAETPPTPCTSTRANWKTVKLRTPDGAPR